MFSDRSLIWIQLGLELPFVALHVMVLSCVLLGIRRKEPMLASAFFRTYCMQSVAEIANYFLFLSWYRLLRLGYTAGPFIAFPPLWQLMHFFSRTCYLIPFMTHAAIALNRYRVIASPLSAKDRIFGWKSAAVLFLIWLRDTSIVVLGRLVAIPEGSKFYAIGFDPIWTGTVLDLTLIVYCVLTAGVSFVLELRTFSAYLRLDERTRKGKRDDYRLLVYAVTQFLAQLVFVSFQVIQGFMMRDENIEGLVAMQSFLPYVNDLQAFCSPICLLLTR